MMKWGEANKIQRFSTVFTFRSLLINPGSGTILMLSTLFCFLVLYQKRNKTLGIQWLKLGKVFTASERFSPFLFLEFEWEKEKQEFVNVNLTSNCVYLSLFETWFLSVHSSTILNLFSFIPRTFANDSKLTLFSSSTQQLNDDDGGVRIIQHWCDEMWTWLFKINLFHEIAFNIPQ